MANRIHAALHRLKGRLLRGLSRRRLAFLCALAVALLAFNGLVFYQNMRTVVDHEQAVRRSQEIMAALDGLLTSLDDAETGERGYIITGDKTYLQPYTAALAHIDPQERQLAALVADNAQQQYYLPRLRSLVAAKLAEMQIVIGTLQSAGAATAAERFLFSDQDENIMVALRDTIGTMKRDDLALLDRRSAQSQDATRTATISLIVAIFPSIVLIVGIFALIQRDVMRTSRIMAEREQSLSREQAARIAAEDAVRMRDTFLSLASHELKTPLTSLLGNAQLLQRGLAQRDELSEREQRKLESIMRQCQRLRLLTEQLLDTSRLQHGQLSIEHAPVAIGELVGRAVEDAQSTTSSHRLEVLGADTQALVLGDALRLEQVLQNLLGNAIKYSPFGGRISIAVIQEDGYVRVAVTDAGIGIPEAAQAQLFERFYRAANVAGKGTISGLGIGLYVVKEIVTQHGGRVEVRSTEGAGSTFIVHLPLYTWEAASGSTGA
ncbi:MAG TPA: ATP-binding protein [Chloroflexota bacterium]|nr:ATP-binding protein [Chloroflexota bacterium]